MANLLLKSLSNSIEQTSLSHSLQGVEWIVAVVQTVHILAVCLLFVPMCLSGLRVMGLLNPQKVLFKISNLLNLQAFIALITLALSGSILIIGEPARALLNPVFQLKMGLLVIAIAISYFVHLKDVHRQILSNSSDSNSLFIKCLGVLSILLWVSILFSGRWIAYT